MFGKSAFLKHSTEKKPKELYLLLFITAFVGMMIAFLPTMITNDGIFLYYGDFNSQQVMFYQHANDVIRDGGVSGWDWGTDLGSSFIGSYAFYLLGSPFFWITTIFPSKAVPFLIPWLLALKTALAAVFAYAFIRRFVNSPSACFIGGILYAYSGFQVYNVFFNHFHDATAFFPMLLLGFEMLVKDKKKGAFAIPVAICACISYFFFASEIIFLIIYFAVRLTDEEFRKAFNLKTFGLLALESVLGVMMSAIILLPACLDILSNPRLESRLYGLDMFIYSENVRIPRILQAFFMVSDMPARVNLLQSDNARWASIAGYLPMFSVCGVAAFMRTRKKRWESKLIIICLIMACIPILNCSFMLFNGSYYARWFYMPILIMCLMSAKIMDENPEDLKKGLLITVLGGLFFVGIGLLPQQENGKLVFGKIAQYADLFTIQEVLTIAFIIALLIAALFITKMKQGRQIIAAMTAVSCIVCMVTMVNYGSEQGEYMHYKYIKNGIYGSENLDLEKLDAEFDDEGNSFYRIDTSPDVDNWCMFWHLSSMRTFHSVVSSSIMDFYQSIGETRDVASRIEPNIYALRGLFSVRYYFQQLSDEQLNGTAENVPDEYQQDLADFKYVDTQNGFNIYENQNWVPMGFAFDKYITDSAIQNSSDNADKANLLMEGLVLDDVQIKKYSDCIEAYDTNQVRNRASYAKACEARRSQSCYYFKESSEGFDAKINLDNNRLVFFSVPYDKGWTAEVNGAPATIEKVSYGFMAVRCSKGDNTITFKYKTPGLTAGTVITFTGIGIFAAYIGISVYMSRKSGKHSKKKTK